MFSTVCSPLSHPLPIVSNFKRMVMKKYAWYFLFIFLTACELIVDIEVPFKEAQLTINSFFNADSLWTASLSINQGILDTSRARRIENGLIIIYEENIPVDTLTHIVNGVYRSDNEKPMLGRAYEIRASASEYKPISGRSYIPMPSSVTKADITESITIDGYPESVIRVSFTDDPLVTNYYQIFLEAEQDWIDPFTGVIKSIRSRLSIESDDPIVQNNNDVGYDGIFLRDILFNGGEGIVSFKTSSSNTQFYPMIIVTLRTVSEDFYKYKITGSVHDNSSDNPFAQPVNVYKNIDNGFGIFAGYSESNFTIGKISERPVITSITPLKGRPGDHVIITGENFGDGFSFVIFKGIPYLAEGSVMRSTNDELEVIIPPKAISGKIYVSNGSKITASEVEFEVIE